MVEAETAEDRDRRRGWLSGLPRRLARAWRKDGLRGILRRFWQFFVALSFSSLTRRIVVLNVVGLLALVVGILYLSQFRAGLIEARVQSLLVQGEIIANAIAASGTADSYNTFVDRESLQLQLGENFGAIEENLSGLEFSINPERVAPALRRLISPTKTRARIYDRNGFMLIDSRNLYLPGEVLRFDLPPPDREQPNLISRLWIGFQTWLGRGDLPLYRELPSDDGKSYPEVARALGGNSASMVRVTEHGEVIVSVAVPVQRFRAVRGALLLSTQGGDIDQAVRAERMQIFTLFVILLGVMVVLSTLLAGTIAGPVRRLAESAERVRYRTRSRVEIPDFTRRRDEIGHLSGALRDMTTALYSRIEAIESFAADVAHELKNPLTSLRSAVETMPLAKTEASRQRLLSVIEHDVRRLDRLISDISDASRLDAELQRHESAPVDLVRLLNTVVNVQNEVRKADRVSVNLTFEEGRAGSFIVSGHDSRLGQVVDNLIANARSFSPEGGSVRVICRRLKNAVEIAVEDNGPGIRPDAFEKIFDRFYTDRPEQGFGQNSGLGLSISKQIVDAHGGKLWAENRTAESGGDDADRGPKEHQEPRDSQEPRVLGARFVVRLPAP